MGDSQGKGNGPKPLLQRKRWAACSAPASPHRGGCRGAGERGGQGPRCAAGHTAATRPGHARELLGAPEGASADPVTPPLSTASRPHVKPDTNASGMRHRCLCTEARANRTHGEDQQPARGAAGHRSLGTVQNGGPGGIHALPRTCHRVGKSIPCPIHPQSWLANRYRKTPAASQRCLAPAPSTETITGAAEKFWCCWERYKK